VTHLNIRNNFYFWSNFKILLDFEVENLETNQI
jgi:hypothetical protein